MAGASSPHGRISGNLFVLIDMHLRSQPCETFIADMKVGITDAGPYYYPDVVVTCHPWDRRSSFVKRHPRMIIEVLSPRTSTLDRGDKLNDYCSLSSLEGYLLVRPGRAARGTPAPHSRRRLGDQGAVEGILVDRRQSVEGRDVLGRVGEAGRAP
jgi:Uma2 family endonuclease